MSQEKPYRDGFATVNGLRLHYLEWGTPGRPPLLLLHGGSAYAHWWDLVAPEFTQGFHVIALDQRGHGDSDHAHPPAYGTRHYLDDLHQFLLLQNFKKPVLMGHSMGGHNALIYATQHARDLSALILVDTDASYPQAAVHFLQRLGRKPRREFDSLERAISSFRLLPRETLLPKEKLRHLASFAFTQLPHGKWVAKLDRNTLFREPIDGRPLLSQITCPTLLIRAQHSPVLTREKAARLVQHLPQGRWVEVSNSYHHVMLDNPQGLVQAVREFLSSLPHFS